MKCYQKDYPRPQFVRTHEFWENLNGSWDFAFDTHNEGIAKKWFNRFPEGKKITVPFSYESPASGIGGSGRFDVVWYRRPLGIDAKKKQGKLVILHFRRVGLQYQGLGQRRVCGEP
jgi:beta-galactosidase/beta-glucuronidase